MQTPESQQQSDTVRLAILQSALIGVAREMGTIMERASYSSILNEGKDFSCAIFSPAGELVAEGEFVLVHLAAMHAAVEVFIREFGASWRPGDIAIHNDPYDGGSHLPDINLIRPVFVDDEVVAYVTTRAHYPDVGGRVPGSFSGEAATLYDEGVAIPALLLARNDVIDEQLVALWARNVRVPSRLRADLMAQVASVRIGERRVQEIAERFGLAAMRADLAAIPDHGETILRRRIAERLRNGTRTAFDFMDDAGPETTPVRIQLDVSVEDDELTLDFRQSDPQVACPINAPRAVVKSAAFGAVKCLLAPELPLTSGMFRPLHVLTSPGTVTDPTAPAPVAAGNTNTSMRIFDLCVAALNELATGSPPGIAGSYSANTDIGMGGQRSNTGEQFVLYMMPVGGIGASATQDGESAQINYMGNCASQPVEVLESLYPFRLLEYRLRPSSGGPGRRRGGLGLRLTFEITGDDLEASIFTERQRFAPFGVQGGLPGSPGRYQIRRGDAVIPLQTKTSGLRLRTGDLIEIETAGGGGYGDPWEREPELLERDLRTGFITSNDLEDYGAVVDQHGQIDETATRMGRRARPGRGPLTVARIIDGPPAIYLPANERARLSVKPGDILYCWVDAARVQIPVSASPADVVAVAQSVATTLELQEGSTMHVRPIGRSWEPVNVDQVRRALGRAANDSAVSQRRAS